LNERARARLLAGDAAGARELLKQALASAPRHAELWLNLAAALRGLGEPDEEMAALDRVLALEPRHLRAQLQKPSLLELLGQPGAAAALYRTALQMIPLDAGPPPSMRPVLQAAANAVAANNRALLEVLGGGPGLLEPCVALPAGVPLDQWRELNHSRRWGVNFLWKEGVAFPEHLARCRRTVRALDAWPRCEIPGCGPTAVFSILDAKTRIPPHTGVTNARLIVHLPLVVPPGCGFRVGAERREWRVGAAFVFDDTIEHEAWNDSDAPCAVLILDICGPHLRPAERELVAAIAAGVGEYYGSAIGGVR